MKKQEMEILVQAGDVENVVISRDWTKTEPNATAEAGLWEVWAFGGKATSARGSVIRTARGERRMFSSLDTAYKFVQECGFRGTIEIEERFRPDDAIRN